MSLEDLCKQPPTFRKYPNEPENWISSSERGLFLHPVLIIKPTGLFGVHFLEALRYNFFSWAPFPLICQKNQAGQKEGVGVCGWILFWSVEGNWES